MVGMYDIIKADLGFGLYRFADTEYARHVAGTYDEEYENNLTDRLTASRRRICSAEAMQLRDLAEFAAARPGTKPGERFSEWAADEIVVAMRWTRNMAFTRLHLAVTVVTRLPGTLLALQGGVLDLRGVQAIAELTDPLDDATARAVEEAVLPVGQADRSGAHPPTPGSGVAFDEPCSVVSGARLTAWPTDDPRIPVHICPAYGSSSRRLTIVGS